MAEHSSWCAGAGATACGSNLSRNGYYKLIRLITEGGAPVPLGEVPVGNGAIDPTVLEIRPTITSDGRVYFGVAR